MTGRIHVRAERISTEVGRLRTLPKIGEYTALALSAHIGPIERFEHARSLANYFGITPGCRNSGETDRPGSITKAGHPFIRFLLAQRVLHALRGDPGLRSWYRHVKRRRGSKIARPSKRCQEDFRSAPQIFLTPFRDETREARPVPSECEMLLWG